MKHFRTLFTIIFVLTLIVSSVFAQVPTITFSLETQQAVKTLAQDILTNGLNPQISDIKAQLDPQDYATVKTIGMLPDHPFYFLKDWGRNLRIFFTFDQIGKTHLQLKKGNQKTLEALLLLEKAIAEKDTKKHDRLIALANSTLENVGNEFDQVQQTIARLKRDKSSDRATVQDDAFRFASQYLKHQVLLQQQEDRLNNADFLTIESTRVQHLGSLADIVVASNRTPEVFSEQLVEVLSSQVGSNYSRLSLMAILRDLENNASETNHKSLEIAQSLLHKEFEVKLSKLSKAERLKLIRRYASFIHGNPIRKFQAYNLISKSFTSKEMQLLTANFKDKAAQSFKTHLTALDTEVSQKQFVQTLFSSDPIDIRLLAYTEIRLQKPKVLGIKTQLAQVNLVAPKSPTENPSVELQHLQALKTILDNQLCQNYGQNPESLKVTRFFTQATTQPDILDIRVAQFVNQSIKACDSKTPETNAITTELTNQIEQRYIDQAKQTKFTKLPTKTKAKEILQEEQIETSPQDEQKVAEQVSEEITQIEKEFSTNLTVIKEKITSVEKVNDTVTDVVSDEQTIIEEIIQSDDPTDEEIAEKEEQIIEEIVASAQTGTTTPLTEELPQEIQKEIIQKTAPFLNPNPTTTTTIVSPRPAVTAVPIASPAIEPSPTSTVIEQVIETAKPAIETATSPAPVAPEPTLEPATAPGL